jgi:hypothetical protein
MDDPRGRLTYTVAVRTEIAVSRTHCDGYRLDEEKQAIAIGIDST